MSEKHRFRLYPGKDIMRCTRCYAWDDDKLTSFECLGRHRQCNYPECGGDCWECKP